MELDSQRSKSYRRELHDLVQRACTDGEMGSMPMRSLLLNEAQYCHHLSQNAFTIELSLDTWMDNFRKNLPYISVAERRLNLPRTDRKALVVGAGPSAITYYGHLRDKDIFTVCTNKSLEFLVANGMQPDVVVILHSTPEIKGTIRTDIVSECLGKIGKLDSVFIIPTTIDSEVFKEIDGISYRSKHYWFNPAVPEEQVENINQFMERMTGLPVIDTGGDVGVFALLMALEMTTGPVGIIGLEHCLKLKKEWTNEQALGYRIEYAPESYEMLYAIPPSFQVTLDTMVKLCNSKGKGRVYNLSNFGPVYARKLLPYMAMEDFACQNKEPTNC